MCDMTHVYCVPLQFYPSLFVLVTEILDTFGRLVFERIKQKGLTPEGKLKMRVQDFGPRDVTEEARETCKNWFYKVASIRELVPRLYMEIAIIRCNQFLYGYAEFDDTLRRLTSMIRGIGVCVCCVLWSVLRLVLQRVFQCVVLDLTTCSDS